MNDTISVKTKSALEAYSTGDKKEKSLLEKLFGKQIFQDITAMVKSFEDAIAICPPSKNLQTLFDYNGNDDEMLFIQAVAKRNYIAKVLRQEWEADYKNSDQEKWYCWFEMTDAGFGFSDAGTHYDYSNTFVGARLSFPTRELAEYFGNNFTELHNYVLSHN